MNTTRSEISAMMTPVFVLISCVTLVILAAVILRDPKFTAGDLTFLSSAETPGSSSQTGSNDSDPVQQELAATESQLIANMEYFDSRFERFTSELKLAEEKALSRSDLVGTRYQLKSVEGVLQQLQEIAAEWNRVTTELLTGDVGRSIAASPELLKSYMKMYNQPRISEGEIAELKESLEPLSRFVTMLEGQDNVPYEPGERFRTRVTSLIVNAEKSVTHYEMALAEIRRLVRIARQYPAGELMLIESFYRSKDGGLGTSVRAIPKVEFEEPPAKSEEVPTPSVKPEQNIPKVEFEELTKRRIGNSQRSNMSVAITEASSPANQFHETLYRTTNLQSGAVYTTSKPAVSGRLVSCRQCGRQWICRCPPGCSCRK